MNSSCFPQEGLTEIAGNIVEINVADAPYKVNFCYYRGDAFSFTIIGRNDDDSPFNFDDVLDDEQVRTYFRIGSANGTIIAKFEKDDHVLGQTREAIDYDTDQGNSPGFTMDEIHILDPDGDLLNQFYESLYFDTEMITKENSPKSLISGVMELVQDVTRVTA